MLLLLRQWGEFFHWRHLIHLVWKECPDPTAPLRADAPSCLDPSDFRHAVRDAVCVVLVLVLSGDVEVSVDVVDTDVGGGPTAVDVFRDLRRPRILGVVTGVAEIRRLEAMLA